MVEFSNGGIVTDLINLIIKSESLDQEKIRGEEKEDDLNNSQITLDSKSISSLMTELNIQDLNQEEKRRSLKRGVDFSVFPRPTNLFDNTYRSNLINSENKSIKLKPRSRNSEISNHRSHQMPKLDSNALNVPQINFDTSIEIIKRRNNLIKVKPFYIHNHESQNFIKSNSKSHDKFCTNKVNTVVNIICGLLK